MIMKKKLMIFTVAWIILIVFVVVILEILSLNPPPLNILNLNENMLCGYSQQIVIECKGKQQDVSGFYFISTDSESISVTDKGEIIASKPGSATIIVQSKKNEHQKIEFTVNSTYHIFEEIETSIKYPYKKLSSVSSLPFIDADHVERMDDWDIMAIAKMILNTEKGDYVFTDTYLACEARNDVLILISDWGNEDVVLDKSIVNKFDLSQTVSDHTGAYDLGENQVNLGIDKINRCITSKMYAYKNMIFISQLPKEYEYRVSIRGNYNVYELQDFYSKGKLRGIWEVAGDLISGRLDTFLKSYTDYKLPVHFEMIFNNCELIIERRLINE